MKTRTQIQNIGKLKSLALIGTLALVGVVQAQANLLVNGDFTANASLFTGYPGYADQPGNPLEIAGWVNIFDGNRGVNGPLTGVGDPFGPTNPGGLTYAFMEGGSSLPHVLVQFIPLANNTTYSLNFDVAGSTGYTNNPGSNVGAYQVDIGGGGLFAGFGPTLFTTGPQVANNDHFEHVTATFTTPALVANGGNQLMQLWGNGIQGNVVNFANVSVEVVPEPTTFALVGLGMFLVGVGRRSRRSLR